MNLAERLAELVDVLPKHYTKAEIQAQQLDEHDADAA